MQVQFKRPVTIGKETYGKGVHNVPDADVKDNWFFDGLVKEGNAIILRAEEPAAEAPSEAKATRKSRKSTEASTDESATAEGE